MRRGLLSIFLLIVCAIFFGCVQQPSQQVTRSDDGFLDVSGPYFGEEPPGMDAILFAPGIISTGCHDDGGPAFTKDGNEAYFRIYGKPAAILLSMKQVNGRWTKPEITSFSGKYMTAQPYLSPNEDRLFFSSSRPMNDLGEPKDHDIWYVDRTTDGWSEAKNLGSPFNTEQEENICGILADNTIYFYRIKEYGANPVNYKLLKSTFSDGTYGEPELVGRPFNDPEKLLISTAFSADGSYIVLSSKDLENGFGDWDLYVTFKQDDGSWTEPKNLGKGVNCSTSDWLSSLSPDGKYLFFTSYRHDRRTYSNTRLTYQEWQDINYGPRNGRGGDMYWVSTDVIEQLRPKQ